MSAWERVTETDLAGQDEDGGDNEGDAFFFFRAEPAGGRPQVVLSQLSASGVPLLPTPECVFNFLLSCRCVVIETPQRNHSGDKNKAE